MLQVYIVAFFTSGERYQTILCANMRAVRLVLVGYAPDDMCGDVQNWRMADTTQKATVRLANVIQ